MDHLESAKVFVVGAATVEEGVENCITNKYLILALKAVIVFLEIIFETLALYSNHQDLKLYQETPILNLNHDNKLYSSTVNVGQFESSFYAFSAFYAIEIVVAVTLFCIQGWRIFNEKEAIPFLWAPVTLFVELPLMVSESLLLKSRGIINWHDQKMDMILHIIFIFNLPLQTIIDVWARTGKTKKGFLKGIFLSPLCFILGCMIYAPIAAILICSCFFDKVNTQHFGKIDVTGDTKSIMLILANIGQIGQWIWGGIGVVILILICAALAA